MYIGIQINIFILLLFTGKHGIEGLQSDSTTALGKAIFTFNQILPNLLKLSIASRIYNGTVLLDRQQVSFPVIYRNKLSDSPYITNETSTCHYSTYLGSFSVCHGIKGFLRFPDSSIHINSLDTSITDVFSKHSYNVNVTKIHFNGEEKFRNGRLRRRKRSLRFSPSTPYVVKLYFITDNELRKQHSTPKQLIDRVISIMNVVNAAYQVFNVTFAIVGLEIWGRNMISLNKNNPELILRKLENYKRNNVVIRRADCVHMLIGQIQYAAKGEPVGRARIGSMCSLDRCVGFSLDSFTKSDMETALVVAHELGHNFGMSHDKHDTDCQTCIMSPSMEYTRIKLTWSEKSQETMRDVMKQGLARCLESPPVGLDSKVKSCGNGIVEGDEECDCGTLQSMACVQNKCCDVRRCRLVRGAQCATGSCCDKSTCQLKVRSHECRAARGPCDLPEYCDGRSEYCPKNVHKSNGVPCVNGGQAYCFGGDCQTRQSWCQALWGPTGQVAVRSCFNRNLERHAFGHCLQRSMVRHPGLAASGHRPDVIPCRPENIMCGRLWCDHQNEKTMFYGVVAQYSYEERLGAYCEAVIGDIGDSHRDPGLVPNGASCGHNRVCFNSTCVPVEKIRPFADCSCGSHGVCNNLGHCHCDEGFGPPTCVDPGTGGSIDSGPPPSKWSVRPVIVVLIVILLLFLPFVIILTLICVKNRKKLAAIKFRYRSVPTDKNKRTEGSVEYKNTNGTVQTETKAKIRNKSKTKSATIHENKDSRGPPPKPPPKPVSLTLNIRADNQSFPSPDTPPLPPYPKEYAIPNGFAMEEAEKPKKKLKISSPIFQTSTNAELQFLPPLERTGAPGKAKSAHCNYPPSSSRPPPPPPPPSYTKPALPPHPKLPPSYRS